MKHVITALLILVLAFASVPSGKSVAPKQTQEASFYGYYCFQASGHDFCCTTSWWGLVDSCSGKSFSMLYFNHKPPKKVEWLAELKRPSLR